MDEKLMKLLNWQVEAEVQNLADVELRMGINQRISLTAEKVIDGVVLAISSKDEDLQYLGRRLADAMINVLESDPSPEVKSVGVGLRRCLESRRVLTK
jgi:hypothetical protein